MNVGDIVWIDGSTPAIVVGLGHDTANIGDGRVFVARLGDAEVIERGEDGSYPFGSSPYDTAAGTGDPREAVNPGGFGPNTPAVQSADEQQRAGMALPGASPLPTGGFDPAGTDAAATATPALVPAETMPAVDPTPTGDAQFTDNGDGTYTRTSDGVRGTFGPSGFNPDTATAGTGTNAATVTTAPGS